MELKEVHSDYVNRTESEELHMFLTITGTRLGSLVPRPHPSAREKGLVTIAGFLVCVH